MSSTTHTTRTARLTKRWDAAGIAVLALAGLAALVPLVMGLAVLFQGTVTVPDMLVDVAPEAAGIGQAHALGEASVDIEGMAPWVRALVALQPVGQGIVGLAGTWALVGLLRDIGRGRPFTESNVRRLTTLALLCLVAALILPQVGMIAQMAVMTGATTFRSTTTVSLAPLIAAVVAGSLAVAFRRGMQLEHDVDGLV